MPIRGDACVKRPYDPKEDMRRRRAFRRRERRHKSDSLLERILRAQPRPLTLGRAPRAGDLW